MAPRRAGRGVDAGHLPADGLERLRRTGTTPGCSSRILPPRAVAAGDPVRLEQPPSRRVHAGDVDELCAGPTAVGSPRARLPPDQPDSARPGGRGRVRARPAPPRATRSERTPRVGAAIDARGGGGGAHVRAPPASGGGRGLGERSRDGARRAAPHPGGPRVRDGVGARAETGRVPGAVARGVPCPVRRFAPRARDGAGPSRWCWSVLDVYPLRRLGLAPGGVVGTGGAPRLERRRSCSP